MSAGRHAILVRHAHADWPNYVGTDFDRPLTPQGLSDAGLTAAAIRDAQYRPTLLLASPARRTQQTADIVARELSLPARRVRREEALYLASASDMLKLVYGTGPRVAHLLLVAHNPGVSELAQLLLRQHGSAGLPTAAVCSIAFDAAQWAVIGSATVTDVQREKPPARLFGLLG